MIKTSEWVSIGHPDKVADYISSYLLDRYIEKDPQTRYAVEVQIKDNFVTLGGEITSIVSFSDEEISNFVKNAVNNIGYTREYQKKWGAENTICGDDLQVTAHISKQSTDIAVGVDNNGWGDQGIFWGMATNTPKTNYMPIDYQLAKNLGNILFNSHIGGLDIKTQVTIESNSNHIKELVCAVPCLDGASMKQIEDKINYFSQVNHVLIENQFVNGTGIYIKHGPIGDCGTTGRKLAVDLYGGNCRIGGGSPWTKCGTKADLTLNMYARYLAKKYIQLHDTYDEVHCAISCRIGSPKIFVSFLDGSMDQLESYSETKTPNELIRLFSLDKPCFADLCRNGLFHKI